MKGCGGVIITLLTVCLAPVCAQVNRSNLNGIVRDASGASIPGAALELTNVGTGAVRRDSTDVAGLYRFMLVDFGTYTLKVEAVGFRPFVREKILLQTGETTTVDVRLELGALTEQIKVTGESPMLRTETGALGVTLSAQAVSDLPYNVNRNPHMIIQLAPGIQSFGVAADTEPWHTFGLTDFDSSGSTAKSEFLLDGLPNMRLNTVAVNPSPEAIAEVRVQTNAFDAEFGHSGASFVNVSSKGGTNEPHGNVYWFNRNTVFNASSYWDNKYGFPKVAQNRNTGGFTLSGPVYIPKVYNGRDRAHFFVNWENTRMRDRANAIAIVPTLLERAGDFSKTTDRAGNPFTIYDPETTRPAGTGLIRSAFSGNRIPQNRFDRVAVKAMNYYPEPNMTPVPGTLENFSNLKRLRLDWQNLATRGDYQISSNHQLFGRYSWNRRINDNDPFYGENYRIVGDADGDEEYYERGNIGVALGYTWIWSPQTAIDVRPGLSRWYELSRVFGDGFDLASMGFPASFVNSVKYQTFPRFAMSSSELRSFGSSRSTFTDFFTTYNLMVNVHTRRGRHVLKYGGRGAASHTNQYNHGRISGEFSFNSTLTRGPDPTRTVARSGHSGASFLLGTPTSGSVAVNQAPATESAYFGAYLQDDWKVTARLTLNLGMRLEHDTAMKDRFNRGITGFDAAARNPVEAQVQANYAKNPIPELANIFVKGGLGFHTESTGGRNYNTAALLYAPRFGFAYRLTDRLVWRGGYGVFYDPLAVKMCCSIRMTGFSVSTPMVTSLDNNMTPFNRLQDPYPQGIAQPPGSSLGLRTLLGQSVSAELAPIGSVADYKQGLSQQFSMGFQFVLPGAVSVETSYVGNNSQRLTISRSINNYPDEYLPLKTRLNATVPNPFQGVITDITSAMSRETTTVSQLLRPFPQFTGVTAQGLPYGRTKYDSLQVQVSKRMSAGLTFGASYTLSKAFSMTSYMNSNDAKLEKVIASHDRPQRLVLHGTYELPFGSGKRFVNSTHPVLNRIVGGWQISWIGTYQSGEPLSFGSAERRFRSDNNPRTEYEWFDKSQFVAAEPFTLRYTSSRIADLHAPGIKKWDLTAIKEIRLAERVSLRIMAEAYNAFNTTQFGSPNTSVTSSDFGLLTPPSYSGSASGGLPPRQMQISARISW